MQRTALIGLAIAALTSVAAAEPEVSVAFWLPGQAGPGYTSTAAWALLILLPDAVNSIALESRQESSAHNETWASWWVNLPGGSWVDSPAPAPTGNDSRNLPPFHAAGGFTNGQHAFLYVEGQDLQVKGTKSNLALKQKLDGECPTSLLLQDEHQTSIIPPNRPCPVGDHAAIVARNATGFVPFELEAYGRFTALWHNLDFACQEACPDGGPMWDTEAGDATVRWRSFETLAVQDGRLHANGMALVVAAGGGSMDLDVAGAVRLPKAQVNGSCAACGLDGERTLSLEGNVSLRGLHPAGPGRAGAKLAGSDLMARVDEQALDVAALLPTPAVVGVAVGGTLLLASFLLGLHLRRRPEQTLEGRLLAVVRERPGVHLREAARSLGVSVASAHDQVHALSRQRRLVMQRDGRLLRLFVAGQQVPPDWQAEVVLRNPDLRALQEWVVQHPLATQTDIKHAMGLQGWAGSTTQVRLHRLVDAGAVEVARQGKFRLYRARTPT